MTDMRERLIAMATYGSAYRGSGGLSERAATAERLVLAVERQAVERLLDKARKWHDDGTMTHAEWAAVCAVFYVEDVRPAPERIERIADALAPSPAEPAAPEPPYDEADDMCPNCVTPWKCNGPHFIEFTPRYQRQREGQR